MNNKEIVKLNKDKIEQFAKIAIALFAIFLMAPFIFLLIKGIIGIAAAVVIASLLIALAPAASLAIANMGVSLLKIEAARNPVETLQNEYKEKARQLEDRKEAIELGMAKLKTFENKVAALGARYPEEVPQFEAQLKPMQELLAHRKDRFKTAARKLKDFHDVVEKADAIWQVTQALNEMAVGQSATDDFYSELRTKTALDSVQESLAHSFAALDTSLLEEEVEREYLGGPGQKLIGGHFADDRYSI